MLYYIGEIYRGEGKEDWMRKGGVFAEKGKGKGHFGEEIEEKIGNLTGT